ncbi:MAG: hypothetical protein KC423_00985 [Anaerolineales bacterium]|nr:hypothetical protein [Anaerolineales bacterium]
MMIWWGEGKRPFFPTPYSPHPTFPRTQVLDPTLHVCFNAAIQDSLIRATK